MANLVAPGHPSIKDEKLDLRPKKAVLNFKSKKGGSGIEGRKAQKGITNKTLLQPEASCTKWLFPEHFSLKEELERSQAHIKYIGHYRSAHARIVEEEAARRLRNVLPTYVEMAAKFAPIEKITPGMIDWKIEARVIRVWKQPEYMNPDKIRSIELILLDKECSKIQATIQSSVMPRFEPLIEEGCAYAIENFLFARIDPKFKPTKHKFKLNFMGSTKLEKKNADCIPKTFFEFVPFPSILGGVEDGYLIDVIGHVVQRDIPEETTSNGVKTKLLDITLEDLENNRIICTLWSNFAEEMQRFLDNHKTEGAVVVVLQMCKLRMFNGMMGISNAYNGTKLLINANLAEVSEYRNRLENKNAVATQVVSQMSGQSTISLEDDVPVAISDLMEVTEPCFCTVLGKGNGKGFTKKNDKDSPSIIEHIKGPWDEINDKDDSWISSHSWSSSPLSSDSTPSPSA